MNKTAFALAAAMAALTATGCATKDYVHEYVGGQVTPVAKRVDGIDGRVAGVERRTTTNEAGIQELNRRADAADSRIEGLSRASQEALDRAKTAGKLAEGKLLYEVVMSDDTLRFSLEGTELSKQAKQQLDSFADKLKAENRNVYVEIQGHTDRTGSEAYNLKLSSERAEMVKRYLNMKCGIPLHRMATIGYGESAPVADNRDRAGRAQNRRVVLVVLN